MAQQNENSETVLPITVTLSVISFNRVSIPAYLSFIDPGDTLIGTIEHEFLSSPQYFSKQVSSNRTITVGFLKPQFPNKKLPEQLTVTIKEVRKQSEISLEVNVLGYIRNQDKLILVEKSLTPKVLDVLKDKAKKSVEQLYSKQNDFPFQILKGQFLEQANFWIIPVIFYLQGDFGLVPSSLLLTLDQEKYNKFLANVNQINLLIERFVTWLNFEEDLNDKTLCLFSSQLSYILETNTLPHFYGLQEILTLDDELKKRILVLCIKNRKKNGLSFSELSEHLADVREETLRKKMKELVEENLLILLDKENNIYDISWLL